MNDNKVMVMLIMMVLAFIMAGCGVVLSRINSTLQKQFQYQVEYDMCLQNAWDYGAMCRVEQDEDGEYHWYFNPNEEVYYVQRED